MFIIFDNEHDKISDPRFPHILVEAYAPAKFWYRIPLRHYKWGAEVHVQFSRDDFKTTFHYYKHDFSAWTFRGLVMKASDVGFDLERDFFDGKEPIPDVEFDGGRYGV